MLRIFVFTVVGTSVMVTGQPTIYDKRDIIEGYEECGKYSQRLSFHIIKIRNH